MNIAQKDQLEAAEAHAAKLNRRILDQVGPVTESTIQGSQVPAVVAWNDVMRNHPEDARFCEHVGGSPMPVYGRMDTPGTIVCFECFATVLTPLHREKDTGIGKYTCDGCSRVGGYLTPAGIQNGPTTILGHLCDTCMKASSS